MFVELIEQLRCPRSHEETGLVATAARTEERYIIDGTLGCPTCGAEFVVSGGELLIDPSPPGAGAKPDQETAMRLAAFLELTDRRGFAILEGDWGAHADLIQRLTETPLALVNPPEGAGQYAAVIRTSYEVPFRAGSVRAAAIHSDGRGLADSIVATVRSGGRVVGRSSLPLPSGLTEIIRDDRMWIAERAAAPTGAPRLVSLKRAGN